MLVPSAIRLANLVSVAENLTNATENLNFFGNSRRVTYM